MFQLVNTLYSLRMKLHVSANKKSLLPFFVILST